MSPGERTEGSITAGGSPGRITLLTILNSAIVSVDFLNTDAISCWMEYAVLQVFCISRDLCPSNKQADFFSDQPS